MEPIEKQVSQLWEVRDHYFGVDQKVKENVIRNEMNRIVEALEKIDDDKKKRGRKSFLIGRALDASSGYTAEAEDSLCRAVKLSPECVEAWNALGHVLWKKGELESAENCFESGIKIRSNPSGHRLLSMVIRAGNGDLKKKDQAIEHARKAVALQIDDPDNWYALANCFVARYFDKAASRQGNDIRDATRAYARAETLYKKHIPLANNFIYGNPDLYNNRGYLRKYTEAYSAAAQDFHIAHSLDPTLKANDMEEDCFRWMKRLADLIKKKGQLKPKKKKELVDKLSALYTRFPEAKTLDSLPIAADPLAGFFSIPSFKKTTTDTEEKATTHILAVIALELRRDTPDVFLAALYNPHHPDDPLFLPLSFFDADTKALVPGTALLIRNPIRFHTQFGLPGGEDNNSDAYDALRIVHAPSVLLEGHTPLQTTLQAVSTGKMLG